MNTTEQLRAFWLSKGTVNERNSALLRDWLKKNGYNVRIPTFIHHEAHKSSHNKAIKALGKNKKSS